MPRKRRLTVPGSINHVMARGIDGRDLFVDDADRVTFLRLLHDGIAAVGFRCYAWVLMHNHYHLILRCNDQPLASLMRGLNSRYARYYAKKYQRRGYLFQDRFKSIATQDQGYVEELIRYVHLNPIRAGMCRSLEQLAHYPWSGHSVILGNQSCRFQDVKAVLRRFGNNPEVARKRYEEFIGKGVGNEGGLIEKVRAANRGSQNILDYGCWVIGDRHFVAKALSVDRENRLRLARYQRTGWSIERCAEFVAKEMGVTLSELCVRGHANLRAQARKVFAYLAKRELGIPGSEISRYLGIGNSSISRSLDEGFRIAQERNIRIIN